MNRLLILILFLFIFANAVPAVYINTKIDSLNSLLKTSTDPEKIEIFNELSKAYDTISYDKSLDYAKQALELTKKFKSKEDVATSLDKVARIYYFLTNYDESINYFIESLKMRENIGDKKAIAQSYNNLGVVYLNLENDTKTLEYLQKAWDLSEEIRDDELMKKTANNLGIVYMKLSNYDKSLEYYRKALNLTKETDFKQLSVCLNNIGMIYWYLENYDKALEYYLDALKINEEEKYKWSISNTSRNIGIIYIEFHNYNKASVYLKKALKIAEEIDSKHLIKDCYITFSHLYFAKGNYKKAYEYHEMYSEVKDSIFTKELGKNIAELEVKFETVKKEKKIEILKNEKEINVLKLENNKTQRNFLIIVLSLIILLIIIIYSRYLLKIKTNKLLEAKNQQLNIAIEKISKSEADLKKLNTTKDKLFSILSHDLRSPFSSILGFSEVLYYETGNFDAAQIKEIASTIYETSRETFDLLDNLLEWSRAQTGSIIFEPENIHLKDLVNSAVGLLENSAKKKDIIISNEIPEQIYVFADNNMINTILRNLLSNAIKFTHKKGKIKIAARDIDDFIEITIADSGVGIKPEDIKKLFGIDMGFSTVGTDNEKGTGLGLILCKEFIEKNNGKIWVESELGKGSNFIFTLPKTKITD
jgi:signal transduction histidine kinase/Tfp pilus assembly protein PilF